MKKTIILFVAVLLCLAFFAEAACARVYVRGYYRKDGTYVSGHYRSSPNAYKYDNYSYQPSEGLYNKSYYSSTRNYSSEWYTSYRDYNYSYSPRKSSKYDWDDYHNGLYNDYRGSSYYDW